MIIGIDPGLDGAIATISRLGCVDEAVELYDMPTSAKQSGKGRQVNDYELSRIIRCCRASALVAVVEAVGPTPQMGVTSAFSFGRTAGVVSGVLAAYQIPTVYVRPQMWKKHFGLLKMDKDASRTLAMQRYPLVAEKLKLKKHIDRAEALLMATWQLDVAQDACG